jgi:hypothetical protein
VFVACFDEQGLGLSTSPCTTLPQMYTIDESTIYMATLLAAVATLCMFKSSARVTKPVPELVRSEHISLPLYDLTLTAG